MPKPGARPYRRGQDTRKMLSGSINEALRERFIAMAKAQKMNTSEALELAVVTYLEFWEKGGLNS